MTDDTLLSLTERKNWSGAQLRCDSLLSSVSPSSSSEPLAASLNNRRTCLHNVLYLGGPPSLAISLSSSFPELLLAEDVRGQVPLDVCAVYYQDVSVLRALARLQPEALDARKRAAQCDLGELETRLRYGPVKRALREEKERFRRYRVKCCVKLCLRRLGVPDAVISDEILGFT